MFLSVQQKAGAPTPASSREKSEMKAKPIKDWHYIKSELHRRGMTLTKLAELNDLHPSACRKVKVAVNRKAEAAIAAFLGVKPEELWPTRYPIQSSRILSNAYSGSLESQKARLAADMGVAA